MKHKLQLLLCSLLLSLGAFSQNIPSYVPTNGLVGWWPFNGNANDESGNGNHGTVNGATLTSDRNGVNNKCYEFNGNNITVQHNNSLNLKNSFSVSFWYLSNSNYFAQDLLMKGPDYVSNSWWIRHHTYSNDPNVNFAFKPNSVGADQIGFPFPTLNTWSFVIAIVENNTLKIYQNGVLKNSLANVAVPTNNTNISNLTIGTLQYGFSGKIDDIAIYNRALTQAEITALFTGNPPCTPTSSNFNLTIPSTSLPYTWNGLIFTNSSSQTAHLTNASGCDSSATLNLTVNYNIPNYVPTNGLVGWWPFNGNANDESGNGNQGTVNGATLTSDRNGVAGKAYSFDGNDWIDALNPGPTGTGITLSYWFKSNQTNLGSVFCYGGNNWGTQFEILHNYWSAQTIGPCYGPALHNSGTLVSFNHNQYLNNNFHHVVFVLPKNATSVSSAYIYVDGNLIANYCSFANYGAPSPNIGSDYPIKIGKNINAGNGINFYNGILDDIAIYNRALTQAEITALYNGAIQITASSGANGSIIPLGTTSVNSGSSQTYTFTPNSGYWIDSVIVNGVQVPTASSYTFSNVTSNQSIRVTYRSLAAALAAANICANDTLVSTVNLPAQSNVRAATYYSNIFLFNQNNTCNAYKYNVNDRKYTAIADKPTVCIECGVAEANGKVYCFNTNGTTQAYDIATNTWQNQTNQPSASNSSVYAASINNKIYVLGYNNNQNSFYQYNPQSNSYSVLANPILSSSQSRLVSYNNKLYKIGGADNNNQAIASVEVYNPSNNTWTVMPDLPEALSQVGATHYDNKLYVFGGKQASNTNSTNSNKVYVFDFTSNTWYAESNTQNTNRTNIEAKTANNMVFLFGGSDATNTQTNQAQRYFCKDQLCNCKWAEYVCNGVSQNEPCKQARLNLLTFDSLNTTGELFAGAKSTGVSMCLNYTNGNGGVYNAQSITSTGVKGLIATLIDGALNIGNGSMLFKISGTPDTSGTAFFSFTFNGITRSFFKKVNGGIGSNYGGGILYYFFQPGDIGYDSTVTMGLISPENNPFAGQWQIWGSDTLLIDSTSTLIGTGAFNTERILLKSKYLDSPAKLCYDYLSNGYDDWYLPSAGELVNLASHVCDSYHFSENRIEKLSTGLNAGDFHTSSEISVDKSLGVEMHGHCRGQSYPYSKINALNVIPIRTFTTKKGRVSSIVIDTISSKKFFKGEFNSLFYDLKYEGGNGGGLDSITFYSTGVIGLNASVLVNTLFNGNGKFPIRIEGVPTSSGVANFDINIGGKKYIFKVNVIQRPSANVSSLAQDSISKFVYLNQVLNVNDVNVKLNYTGGNGAYYFAQSIQSTGVTGLTANLKGGNLNIGNGFLSLNIIGTANTTGTATFTFNFLGKTCVFTVEVTIYKLGTVFCNGTPTEVVEVTNPITGRTWMDRNLGAQRAATSSTDTLAFGDLYQYGRGADGHQCRNSTTTTTLSTTDQPGNGYFIVQTGGTTNWHSYSTVPSFTMNNPCPYGYHVPTPNEWDEETLSWSKFDLSGAFNSKLKLTITGLRSGENGLMIATDRGLYWSNYASPNYGIFTSIGSYSNVNFTYGTLPFKDAMSVRCIKY